MSEIGDIASRLLQTKRTQLKSSGFSSRTYNCQKCRDTGWELYRDRRGYEYAKECGCGKARRDAVGARLGFASIPEKYGGARLETFDTEIYREEASRKAARLARSAAAYWVRNFRREQELGEGLYLCSATKGSGKTRMAASIANELVREYRAGARFATSMQIINAIKGTWDDPAKREGRLLEDMIRAEVLVIDDFGTEKRSADAQTWMDDRFYHVINGRYIGGRVTIFTSNRRIDELGYDERITDRIREKSLLVPFPEESVRRSMAEARRREFWEEVRKSQDG